jgi:hypothetical protein
MRGLMLALIVVGVGWVMYGVARRIARVAPKGEPTVEAEP